MRRTGAELGVAVLVGAALLTTVAEAARPRLGPRGGCTDPIPTERQTALLGRFGEEGIDANGDGVLTCREVNPFMDEHHPMGPGCDRQCTDPIPDERQAMLLERFGDQGIDANGDGVLTCDEVKAFFAARDPGHHGRGIHGNQKGTKSRSDARCGGSAGARATNR